MDIKKPQLVKVGAFAYFFEGVLQHPPYYLHQNMDIIGHYDMIENHFPVNDLPKNVAFAGRTDCHEINAFVVVVPEARNACLSLVIMVRFLLLPAPPLRHGRWRRLR